VKSRNNSVNAASFGLHVSACRGMEAISVSAYRQNDAKIAGNGHINLSVSLGLLDLGARMRRCEFTKPTVSDANDPTRTSATAEDISFDSSGRFQLRLYLCNGRV
jgi:hypothetical protein